MNIIATTRSLWHANSISSDWNQEHFIILQQRYNSVSLWHANILQEVSHPLIVHCAGETYGVILCSKLATISVMTNCMPITAWNEAPTVKLDERLCVTILLPSRVQRSAQMLCKGYKMEIRVDVTWHHEFRLRSRGFNIAGKQFGGLFRVGFLYILRSFVRISRVGLWGRSPDVYFFHERFSLDFCCLAFLPAAAAVHNNPRCGPTHEIQPLECRVLVYTVTGMSLIIFCRYL